jgi:hypothetical protein
MERTKAETWIDELIEDGWTLYKDNLSEATADLYRRVPSTFRCKCNSDKAGVQFTIGIYESQGHVPLHDSVQLNLRAQMPNDEWVDLKVYGLSPENIVESIHIHMIALVRAWDAMCDFTEGL